MPLTPPTPLPVCGVSTLAETEATADRLPPLLFAVTEADAVLEARRLEKNFSLMARAEYLCSMNVGEICIGVVVVVAADDGFMLAAAVVAVAVGLLYLAAIADIAGVINAGAVAICLLLLSLLVLLLLLLLLMLLLMMGEQE